ncbi:eomesodermin [Lepisosteus oculatus]|uniref:Eomesodermin homolog b n=1 Tax=Lepisosteus oculatus TaxID=7918 RepID=W5M357_LEPOC|nr:PREDICTED: eomesodermin homolog [Lepisosteus oculatus]XP_015212291.1 PREDICTED: eomesodermin homolog [Lepisosteus oculatus]XP_015212292.1 PREDICTED: eomesodermin homolog [Lepisosteus oculatus]
MQLGEALLPSTPINLPKTFYNLSSSESNNNSPGSTQLDFQEVDRTDSEPANGSKKYLGTGGNSMLSEGETETFGGAKVAPDGRKSSPGVGEDDLSSGGRYNIDGLGSERYFISSTPQQATEVGNPCSLFPYAGQPGTVYAASSGSRYPASLHYGSVLPPSGFSSAVCAGRSQFGPGYQFGQGPGCLYPSYPATGSSIGSLSIPGTGTGVRAQVYLCNRPLWLKFHRHQTEMIITKQGRRMFPFLSFNITGLNLTAHYNVFVEVVLADPNHWRFQGGKWVTCGKADNNMQGNKMYVHPESPNTGAHWMRQEISFGKLKLTNNKGANNNSTQMIVLQSLHKYQPRLHIVEVTEDGVEDMSSESKTQTFTFPETQFIAVTAYQNTDITQLKIDHNPFAKGFRDNYDSMYTAPENDRLTPSPTDSPRSHQIVPGARYSMQPFFQDQFSNLPQNRFYNGERTVPQTNGILSPQTEEAGAPSAQRWFVTPVQQAGSNKLDLTSYEGDYSTSTLLPYSIKSLPLQTSHALGYYPDSAFASMAAGWGSRGTYQRKMTTGLPWSPRPSPPGFPEDHLSSKDKLREENGTSSWIDTPPSLKSLDSSDSGVYSMVCKRRRVSPSSSSTENSPTIKCEDITTDDYSKDNSKGMGYYAFYTSP